MLCSCSFENSGQLGTGTSHYMYSCDLLLLLQSDCSAAPRFINFPDEMKKWDDDRRDKKTNKTGTRARGQRGGVKRRLRRNKTKPPLIILFNACSIRPNGRNVNLDELQANARLMTGYSLDKPVCCACLRHGYVTVYVMRLWLLTVLVNPKQRQRQKN